MIDPSVKDFRLTLPMDKPLFLLRSGLLTILISLFALVDPHLITFSQVHAATIVVDPGHGGGDGGAGRDSKFTEKQFTLTLARKIKAHLSARHRVELTRSSDVEMAPADRAALANHLRADLMISLHAAVAPYCGNRTAAVYYHADERVALPSETSIHGALAELDVGRPAWVRLQIRHQRQSKYLAAALKRSLANSSAFDSVTVAGVPLVALMGADLPAVLIEVGCIRAKAVTNPHELEHRLNEYAGSIAEAIEMALPLLLQ